MIKYYLFLTMHISKSLFVLVYLKLLVLFSIIFVSKSLMILFLLLCVGYSVDDLFEASYGVDKHEARNVLGHYEVRYQQYRQFKLILFLLLVTHQSSYLAFSKPKVESSRRYIRKYEDDRFEEDNLAILSTHDVDAF